MLANVSIILMGYLLLQVLFHFRGHLSRWILEGLVMAIVFALVVPTLFVLFFYRKRSIDTYEIKHFFVSFCWLMSDVPVIFAMENGFEMFKQLGLIGYMSFLVVATMVQG